MRLGSRAGTFDAVVLLLVAAIVWPWSMSYCALGGELAAAAHFAASCASGATAHARPLAGDHGWSPSSSPCVLGVDTGSEDGDFLTPPENGWALAHRESGTVSPLFPSGVMFRLRHRRADRHDEGVVRLRC